MSYTELTSSHDFLDLRTHVNENTRRRSFLNAVTKTTGTYDLWDNTDDPAGAPVDLYRLDATSGNVEVDLVDAANADALAGRVVVFLRIDSSGNTVQIDPDGTDKVDFGSAGAAYSLSSQKSLVALRFDGTDNWEVIYKI